MIGTGTNRISLMLLITILCTICAVSVESNDKSALWVDRDNFPNAYSLLAVPVMAAESTHKNEPQQWADRDRFHQPAKHPENSYQAWRASLPADYPATSDYMRVMSKFVKYCDKKGYWNGGKLLGPMGGDFTKTYALVMALLVGDPNYDSSICGLSKNELKNRLHTAIGNMGSAYTCSYRSAIILCVAESELQPGDVNILKNYILTHRDAGPGGHMGEPRVNTDGWVAQADHSAENDSWPLAARGMFPPFFPDHAEHDSRLNDLQEDWTRLVCTLDMHGNTTMVGTPAKPLNQWTNGVNINADYTFDNHFYIHTGYMYDTLDMISIVWTVFNEKGHAIPTTFYWNEPNVYNNFLRFLHLWDGRNFYVNGTDWSMYQYNVGSELKYYSGKKFRDNDKVAARIERGLFAHFEWRQKFMAGDLTGFSTYDWSDAQWLFQGCMYDLATSYFHNLANGPWTGGFATEAEINTRANGNFRSWVSSRTITNRTDHRLAKAGEERGWAVIPRNGDHMGTWEGKSVGGTSSGTFDNDPNGNCIKFDDGFATTHTSSFTALPDGKSVLIMEQSGSSRQTWKIGNWLFNDEKRTAYHAGGSIIYDRTGKSGAIASSWFNVDNKIGYIDMEGQTDVFSATEGDISLGTKRTYWPGRYIGYVKFTHQAKGLLLIADVNSAETQNYVTAGNYQLLTTGQSASGAAVLIGQDSSWYLVLSNFSSSAQTVSTTLPFAPASYESITGHTLSIVVADVSASLASHTTGVFRLDLSGSVFAEMLSETEPEKRTPVTEDIKRPLRYRPDGTDFIIENGSMRFNRILYGTNTAFGIYVGDKPEFMMYLPGKGGTLQLGLVSAQKNKWLIDADNIIARYRPGKMLYKIRDAILQDGELDIEVLAMSNAEGMLIRLQTSADTADFDLVWAFGGSNASQGGRRNLDTVGAAEESAAYLEPPDCRGNEFTIDGTTFGMQGKAGYVVGRVPAGSILKVADANKLDTPATLWGSSQSALPVLAGRLSVSAGKTIMFAFKKSKPGDESLKDEQLPKLLRGAEVFRKSVAEKVKVNTPDAFINAAVGAMCTAADAIWESPTYLTGAVAWRCRYNGWRQAYVADVFGWHDRAKTHFRAYGCVQRTDPVTAKPHNDEDRNLTQQAKDSIMYTSGYIPYSPQVPDRKLVYNMNTVFIDQLFSHFLWNGDIDFVREMWPVIERHLAWERRCFDPDDDGLYESYACTWASDALAYSGGSATHMSAYSYRSHMLAARFAELIDKDPKPYRRRAEKILKAIHKELWLADRGWYAENKDLLGLARIHPSAQLWTVYHSIDSGVPDTFKAYQSLRYIDMQIPHIPVCGPGVPQGDYVMLPTSVWMPYTWSLNLVAAEEVAHMSLAYWQGGRRQKAYRLFKSTILDGMYMGRTPGNLVMTSALDAAKGREKYTDFSDTVGTYSRALVEGMFGIVPDVFAGELLIRPGLPREWKYASIETPDIAYSYQRDGKIERFEVVPKFSQPMRLRLRVEARYDRIKSVTVNGQKIKWGNLPDIVGRPQIEIITDQADRYSVAIQWKGDELVSAENPAVAALGKPFTAKFGSSARLLEVYDPQKALGKVKKDKHSFWATASGRQGHRTVFAQVRQGDLTWWLPINFEIRKPFEIVQTKKQTSEQLSFYVRNNTDTGIDCTASIRCGDTNKSLPLCVEAYSDSSLLTVPAKDAVVGSNPVMVDMGKGRTAEGAVVNWNIKMNTAQQNLQWDAIDLSDSFNDSVTQIFKNEYLSPRSPYCSLQIPVQGIGDWCRYKTKFSVNDTGLRAAAGEKGQLIIPQGIPFKTVGPGNQPNIIFTSQWDNYPNEVTMPLTGSASHIYLLMAGSTNAMQSQFDNGEVVVGYTDGTSCELMLRNPTTWWPIERDYFENEHVYYRPGQRPPRVHLRTGKTAMCFNENQQPRAGNTTIGGGSATVLDIPLDADKKLKSLTVRTTANEVVIGLMSATLLRSANL